jgi:serine phosphatase RsbU (regulator of sigma subunit)/CHASE2 domain-containing sensor protein
MVRGNALFGRLFLYQRGRVVALAFLCLYAALVVLADLSTTPASQRDLQEEAASVVSAPVAAIRQYLFDTYQRVFPRVREAQSVAIVGIDENSLKIVGQWPWPRDRMAELIDAIAAHRPAAIGLDIYMPEPDQTSPEQVARGLGQQRQALAKGLLDLPTHDARLAEALRGAPSVLGAAGFRFATLATSAGMLTRQITVDGADPMPFLPRYPFVLASLPQLQSAAQGQALVSIEEGAVVRRVPLVAAIGPLLTPSLAMEMLRVGYDNGPISVRVDGHGIRSVSVADHNFATQAGGDIWLHFAPGAQGEAHRNISAVELLAGKVSGDAISDKLVLIGLTGSGLNDRRETPLRESVAGIEIQAQVLESMFEGRMLLRPWWMRWVEASLVLLLGAWMVWVAPNGLRRPGVARGLRHLRLGGWVSLASILMLALGFWMFRQLGWLFDGASVAVGFATLMASLVSSSTLEVERDNRRLAQEQQQLREHAARLAGEMEAARRIQLGSLPNAVRAFPGEQRFAIDALLEPAREVGGDLYDFFMVDDRHLCFLIGDVSGKGVPASLFMAVTKALARSFATRLSGGPAQVVSAANLDLSRDNVETLFVTLLLGVLDVESGQLDLVNAGHDGPWRLGAGGSLQQVLPEQGEGGPPLCVVDDFEYRVHRVQLLPGDRLCMVTDGITEATDNANGLYGTARLRQALARMPLAPSAADITRQVREDVGYFVAGAEASDDLAILVLHWKGPAPAATLNAG